MLRASVGVTHELRRMNTYGVLGRYIPAFGRIVGRMQYDLFHAYTVDAHTLFVVSNLRRLALPRYNQELPELSRIMQSLPKSEIVYSGRAVSRHRQGTRRGSLRSGRGRCRRLLPGAGPVALRGAPRRLARRQSLELVDHCAEAGHRRSGGHHRICAPRRR
jgi:hypothetical protein